MELIDILSQFGDVALSSTLLGYWVYMLRKDLTQERGKVDKLNEYIRLSDRENIKTLSEFSKFLETLIADMGSMKSDLVKEISSSAENVKMKMDNLKTLMEAQNGRT